MSLIDSGYRPPLFGRSGHLQTIAAYALRSRRVPPYRRERLELSDGDFIDIDWRDAAAAAPPKLAIVGHGLEGCSASPYVISAGAALNARGWSVAAWNMRGCSGEPNRLSGWYHSGKSEDLAAVFDALRTRRSWERVFLLGFSVGGNIVLKFLGERSQSPADTAVRAAAVSAPCDLAASARRLSEWDNHFYQRHFIELLKRKVREKAPRFPEIVRLDGLASARTFYDFDSRYTAPLSGFSSAEDYWEKASSLRVLDRIRVPTLLLTAADDPFLTPSCIPRQIADGHPALQLECSAHGGHVGFAGRFVPFRGWLEGRLTAFAEA